MKSQLDMNKIAGILGAERHSNVSVTGGYFGAAQLVADIEARFRVPAGGGRPTNPNWTEKRLVGLSLGTLHQLRELAAKIQKTKQIYIEPMQLAALILERAACQTTENDLDELTAGKRKLKQPKRKNALL